MNILIFPNGFSMRAGMSENNDDDSTTLCVFLMSKKNFKNEEDVCIQDGRVDHSMKCCCKEFSSFFLPIFFSFHSQMDFFLY